MRKELAQKFYDKWPNWFNWGVPPYCFWGFECGDGWFDIIWNLCYNIDTMLKSEYPELCDGFIVTQVKEKYGGLRFYVGSAPEEIFDLITITEEGSEKICEVCGERGENQQIFGWYMTTCPTHTEERKSRRIWDLTKPE